MLLRVDVYYVLNFFGGVRVTFIVWLLCGFELNSLTDFLFLLVKLLIREPCRVLITRLIETGRQYTVYFM